MPEVLVLKSVENPVSIPVACNVASRIAEQYVAIWGNVDRQGEITHKGAFDPFLRDPKGRLRKGKITLKYNHTTLVGRIVGAEEDSIGLLAREQFATDKTSDRVFGLMREGMLPCASFKAAVPLDGYRTEMRDGFKIRHLVSADLHECGPVDADLAVNPETYLVSMKAMADFAGGYKVVGQYDDDLMIIEKSQTNGADLQRLFDVFKHRSASASALASGRQIAGRMVRSAFSKIG